MPSPVYNLSSRLKLRMLAGESNGRDIGTGFQSLGKDIDEHILGIISHNGSFTAQPGELIEMTAGGNTITLPAPTANTLVGVFCGVGPTTIKAASKVIYGDFVTGAETITLLTYQHVVLQANGSAWFIIAGAPKQEQEYTTGAKEIKNGTVINLGLSRPALVTIRGSEKVMEILIGSAKLFNSATIQVPALVPVTFQVNPGQTFTVKTEGIPGTFEYSYVSL